MAKSTFYYRKNEYQRENPEDERLKEKLVDIIAEHPDFGWRRILPDLRQHTGEVTTVEQVTEDLAGLRIDRAALKDDERSDGKYVLMTGGLETPADELALGYRDMWRADGAFRTIKTALNIEPVYHRKPGRITSHAHLCVLAYLLMTVAENRTETSWTLLREQLERVSLSRIEVCTTAVYRTKKVTGAEEKIGNKIGHDRPPETLQIK